MKKLYDLGYQEVTKLETIAKVLKNLKAVLVDVRFAPTSGNPSFRKENLQKVLGIRYEHVHALGNQNYRGNETQIVDMKAGTDRVIEILVDCPVILMCACWSRQNCHRMSVVEELATVYGITSLPMTRALAKEISEENEPKQLMFLDQ